MIDVGCEHIAVSEARRLGIPIMGVVDTNGEPGDIDFVVPGNDDAIRAIDLYCRLVADACLEGAASFNARVQSQEPAPGGVEGTGPRAMTCTPVWRSSACSIASHGAWCSRTVRLPS